MNHTSPRALIVEDDRAWQQILGEILADTGLAVDLADNVETATSSLRAAPHRLAVVDLALGGSDHRNQDGLRVLEAVRHLDPGCVPIMLTGFATVELAVKALTEYGAFTCLRKEAFRRAQFRALVNRALASPLSARSVMSRTHDVDESLEGETVAVESEKQPPGLALVVEDDAGWRSILAELLSDVGYQVHLCASFGEALGRLRREKYALAVVDLSLEGSTVVDTGRWSKGSLPQSLDGYRLLATTRSSEVPTIVVTGLATVADIERAYAEQGIFACLEKQTFDRRIFLQTVQEARAIQSNSELGSLTVREREVLQLLARGLTNKEIAEALVITTNTVKRHTRAIFDKLAVHTRSAAAAKAISAGMSTVWPEADTTETS